MLHHYNDRELGLVIYKACPRLKEAVMGLAALEPKDFRLGWLEIAASWCIWHGAEADAVKAEIKRRHNVA